MSAHVSLLIEEEPEINVIGSGTVLFVTFGARESITVDRDKTPGFFDALIEIFDVKLPESVEAG